MPTNSISVQTLLNNVATQYVDVGDFSSEGNHAWIEQAPGEEILIQAELKKQSKKRYSSKSDASIGDIFSCHNPAIIGSTEAQRFLDLQHLKLGRPYQFSNPKTLVGVEVEVENVLLINPNIPLLFWAIKEDGSLRNHGREFVTPGVLSINFLEAALYQLFSGLNNDIDFSHRTSIHFHMDVRQFTLQQLVSFVLTYTTVENLLFKYVGNNRRTNIFCVPIVETGLMEHMGDDPKRFMWAIDKSWMKYTAFNLLPIATQGSVEFRHMPGTSDINKLLGWVEMLSRLKTFVYKYSYDTIVNQILHLNSNSMYKQFVTSIFEDMTIYLDMSNLLMDMEKPVYLAKNCSAANLFDKKVTQERVEDSMLGSLLGSWMNKLSADQVQALKEIGDGLIGSGDLEETFRQVCKNGHIWKKAYKQWANHIDRIVSPVKEKKKVDLALQDPDEWVVAPSAEQSNPF